MVDGMYIPQLCNISFVPVLLQSEFDGRRLSNVICVELDVTQRNPEDNDKRNEHLRSITLPNQLYRNREETRESRGE